MPQSANFRKKTGATSGEEPVILLEITHPQLAKPLRYARDTVDLTRGHYLSLPGTSGNYASTPDSAAVRITGDIDVRAKVALDDWTPAAHNAVLSKSNRYMLRVATPSGFLIFTWFDGTAQISRSSTTVVGATDGTAKWVRATLDIDNGAAGHDVKFYTSDDGETWTQLGSTVTTAGTTSIGGHDVNSLRIGDFSGTLQLAGKVYYAEVRNGIDGPVVSRFDATEAAVGATSFVSSTGETWTVHQSGNPQAEIAADETWKAQGFEFSWPDDQAGKLPRAQIRIDNTDRSLAQWLDASLGGKGAVVRVFAVMRDTPDVVEEEVVCDLLRTQQNAAFIHAELGYEDVMNTPALAMSYRPDNSPGIF